MSNIIAPHWNRVVRETKDVKVRDYIYASELGKPMLDRWLSMKGTPVTNPFSDRALRIFGAGNVIEFIVLRALTMAGVLNRKQAPVELAAGPDNLRVTGRLDATIGGFVDWEQAKARILDNLGQYRLDLDEELLESKAMSLLDGLKEQYPDGWSEEMVVEVKSINSMAFWKKGNRDAQGRFKGYDHNKLQLYAYLKMTGLRQGVLLYLSKDDFTLAEVGVTLGDEEMEQVFWDDVHKMTQFYRWDTQPPKEPEVVYNDGRGVFEVNWAVGRSLYLTHAYGYEDEDAFERLHHQELLDVNRALKHLRENKVKPEDLPVIDSWNLKEFV